MTSEKDRRARWNRTRDAAKSRGVELENAPAFLELIEEWVAGKMTMQGVQERHAALVRSRGKSGRGSAPVGKTILEEMFSELPEMAGPIACDPQERDNMSEVINAQRRDAGVKVRG